jgi:type IX secretion system PorP/SprF family membrane protein
VRKYLLFLISIISVYNANGQDLEFSQFYNAPLYSNPALSGFDNGPRFALNYRNEWPSLPNAFVSYAASYDQFFSSINSAVGVIAVSDQQADDIISNNMLAGIFNYRIGITDNLHLNVAFQGGIQQSSLATSRLVFGDMIDPTTGVINSGTAEQLPSSNSELIFDVSAGGLLFSKHAFIGLSAKHLTQPNISFYDNLTQQLPIRLAVNGGYEFDFTPPYTGDANAYLTPNFLYVSQASFSQLNVGVQGGYGVLTAGLAYRHDFTNPDAVIVLAGVQIGVLKLTYSYDITVSDLAGQSGGSHEISLILNFFNKDKADETKALDCPKIF